MAGAGGPSPTDPHAFTTTTTLAVTTTTIDVDTGLADYRDCLSAEGVSITEIPKDALGRPRMADAFASVDLSDRHVVDALETCGRHLSSGALDLSSDPDLQDLVQIRLERFADCVRLEGVDGFPDPVRDFDGRGSPFPVNRVPWADPGLPSAVSICSERLGAP